MNQMAPGDIGVLQNLDVPKKLCLNGCPAEIVSCFYPGDVVRAELDTGKSGWFVCECFYFLVQPAFTPRPGYPSMLIQRHQIRPRPNYPESKTTEKEEALTP